MTTDSTEHAETSAKLYDAVGEVYLRSYGPHIHIGLYDNRDSPDRPTWGEAQTHMMEQLLKLSGMESAKRLLDVGCGHGATACYLAKRLGSDAVGINISPFQVQYANQLAEDQGLAGRAQFLVADGMAPPFGDGEFDVVVSVESAAYMKDKTTFICELSRVLAPGGRIILADFCRAPGALTPYQERCLDGIDGAFASAGNWHSADQYKEIMAANGLQVIAEADWTRRIRGFWELGSPEVLMWRDLAAARKTKERSLLANLAVFLIGFLHVVWLCLSPIARGIFEPARMGVSGFILGHNCRVMRRAFGCGALQYRVVVAAKPAAAPDAVGGRAADTPTAAAQDSGAAEAAKAEVAGQVRRRAAAVAAV